MKTSARGIALLIALSVVPARAQSLSSELDLTGGYSGEEIGAAATQLRIFGDAIGGVRYFSEIAWGTRWSGDDPVLGGTLIGVDPIGSDVFGAAYPYREHPVLMEIYGERYFMPRKMVFGIKAGRFRTPFGIYNRSDHAYSGFIRGPLIRYDGYFALSNNYMENGVFGMAGIPQLFVEGSLGRPHDVGSSQRRDGNDYAVRIQGYHGPFIVGVSRTSSKPYLPARFAPGRQAFNGFDFRWAVLNGVLLRGEILKGHSHENHVSTLGYYADALIHRAGMGPFTAVLRAESLDYNADPIRARSARRFTMGTKVVVPGPVTLQLNYMRQDGDLPRIYDSSLDFSVTYSIRYH